MIHGTHHPLDLNFIPQSLRMQIQRNRQPKQGWGAAFVTVNMEVLKSTNLFHNSQNMYVHVLSGKLTWNKNAIT